MTGVRGFINPIGNNNDFGINLTDTAQVVKWESVQRRVETHGLRVAGLKTTGKKIKC
jgi:hypothetical protein